jgi:hypothetical protein
MSFRNRSFFKRLIIRLLLISFTFSSLFGCNVGSGNSISPSKSSIQAKLSSTDVEDNFEGIGANIISHDGKAQDSNLSFIPDNYSGWKFEYLGCEGKNIGAYNPETISFDARYMFPTTSDYPDMWVKFFPLQEDGQKTPIYDKAYIYYHAVRFNKSDDKGGACYFKLTKSQIGKEHPLFLKTVFMSKSECAEGLPGCTNTSTQVQELLKYKAQENSWWIIGGPSGGLTLGAIYKFFAIKDFENASTVKLFKYMNTKMRTVYIKYAEDVLEPFMFEFKDMTPEQFDVDLINWELRLNDKQKKAFGDMVRELAKGDGDGNGALKTTSKVLKDSKADADRAVLNARKELFKLLREKKEIIGLSQVNDGGEIKEVYLMSKRDGSGSAPLVKKTSVSTTETNIYTPGVNTVETELKKVVDGKFPQTEAVYKLDGRFQTSSIQKGILAEAKNYELNQGLSRAYPRKEYSFLSQETGMFSKANQYFDQGVLQANDFIALSRNLLKENIITFAIMVVFIGAIYAYGDIVTSPPAMGSTSVTINKVKLAVPNDEDVSRWNATHESYQQIKANTKLVTIDKPDLISQKIMLSYINAAVLGVNAQANAEISLKSLSTPMERFQKYDPYGVNRDPFFGDCMDQTDCASGPTKKADAALTLIINDEDSYLMENKDIDLQKSIDIGKENNIPALSTAEPLAAPQVEVLGNSHAGNLDGIMLRQNEPLQLKVTLPKASGNNGDNIRGGGLSAELTTEYDSLEPGEQPIESLTRIVYTKAQSVSAEKYYAADVPVFTSIFNCDPLLKVGDSCLLTIKISGPDDGKPHIGHLMIADVTSFVRYITVYINYHIIQKLKIINVDKGDNSVHNLVLSNVSGKVYKNFVVEGLPEGARLENNCMNVSSDSDCSLGFELGNVTPGKYVVRAYGINEDNRGKAESEIAAMDTAKISINVAEANPW